MNKENIIRSANYELVAKYLSIDPSQVKNYFNYAGWKKRNIENPVDLGNFIDKYELTGPGIYCIENTKNWRKYIGQTTILLNRKKSHFQLLHNKKHFNRGLQEDYNIFWKENFIFIVLEKLKSNDLLLELERKYISYYGENVVYNTLSIFNRDNYSFFAKCLERKADIEKFLASTS